MLKCKICGTEFPAIDLRHYIAREITLSGGIAQAFNGEQESREYDCYDCPQCGCLVIAQERKIKLNA